MRILKYLLYAKLPIEMRVSDISGDLMETDQRVRIGWQPLFGERGIPIDWKEEQKTGQGM